jgi:predicted ArsR family transcriptional regulator
MSSFPPLRLAVLTGLLAIKDNLAMLDQPDSPYDEETTSVLKKLLSPTVVEKIVEKEVPVETKAGRGRPSKDIRLSEEDQQTLTKELRELVDALNTMGTGEGLETKERIAITKTKASVLDQILKMRERNTSAQKVEEFMETVIKMLEDFVSEADREQFLKRMEPYR